MRYRKIGNTGMSAGVIGFGGEHLDRKPYENVKETVDAALEHGINMLDLFMPGDEVRGNFGRAMAGSRDRFIIQGHICSTDLNQQYDISRDLPTARKYFENLLKTLRTDYIDIGMLFFIDSDEDFDKVFHTDILTYAQRLKKQGVIRAVGASSHNPVTARKAVESGEIEVLMFSVNPAFDMTPARTNVFDTFDDKFADNVYGGIHPERLDLYRLCERKGVAITTMKTLGAGKLLSKEHTPFGEPLTVAQCTHYALTRPAVASALLGLKSRAEVEEAVRYLDMSDEELDYTGVISGTRNDFSGHCVYCGHCQPCPAGIDIAAVTKYLDIALLDEKNVPPSIISHYKSLKSGGADCVRCGSCERRCPFGVDIIGNMGKADAVFGKSDG